jgi:putative transposase
MATVTRAYRFALDPTPAQRRALASHCGAARVAHNWGLALVRTRLDQRRTDPGVQVPWTVPELRRGLEPGQGPRLRHGGPRTSKEAYSSGLDGLAQSVEELERLQERWPQGPPGRIPTVQEEGPLSGCLRFTTGAIKVLATASTSSFPHRRLKTHESTRKLGRPPGAGHARVLSATISRTADRWFVSFTSRLNGRSRPPTGRRPRLEWTSAFVTWPCSLTGEPSHPEPTSSGAIRRSLRRLNRGLARRRPASRRRKLAGDGWPAHARAANLRRDALHKLTTTLAKEHATVVVEHSTSPEWSANRRIAEHLPIQVWPNCAACLPTRPPGTAADWWWPTGSTPRPRRARPAAGWKAKLTLAEAHLHLRGLRAAARPEI